MKAAVISIDALDHSDIEVFSRAEHLGKIFSSAQKARSMAITPAQTYPCHVAFLTGCHPNLNGIADNLSHPAMDWQFHRSSIKTPILSDYARKAGLSTAAVCFPVTAGADIDYLVPEIWAERQEDDPDPVFREASSPMGYEYYLRHRDKLDWMRTPGMDIFATDVFVDIIKERQPDLALLHLSYLDHQKHKNGPLAADVMHAVDFIDRQLAKVLEVLGDNYMLFILGDHGHRVQTRAVPHISDERIIIHPTGMTGEIYLNGIGQEEAKRILLESEGIAKVHDPALFHLPSSIDLLVECAPGYAFAKELTPSGHGYIGPDGPYPAFLAYNCPYTFKRDNCTLLDEGPTILKALGIEMEDVEGKSLI